MKKTMYAAFIFAALGMTSCGEQEAEASNDEATGNDEKEVVSESYKLNAGESVLEWRAAWVMQTEDGGAKEANNHTGTIDVTEGNVSVEGEEVKGIFTIDLTSINVTDLEGDKKQGLESHLKGTNEEKDEDDFFNTKEYMNATVSLNSVNDGVADITLNVIGVEINEKVEVQTSMEDDKMMMHGEFKFDLSALDMAMTETDPENGNIDTSIGFKLHLVMDKE